MIEDNGDDNGDGSGGGSSLPGEIIDPIAIASLNAIAGQASGLANLAYSNTLANINLTQQNTVANQQAMNQVGESVLGKTVNLVANLNPMEAVAVTKMDTGNDIAQQVTDLKAAIDGFKSNELKPIVPPPSPPPPLILTPNPTGGIIVTAATDDFPITLAFPNDAAVPPAIRSGGTELSVDDAMFPLEFRIVGQLPKPVGMRLNVNRERFPFTLDIDRGGGEAAKEATQIVDEAKFPVRINLKLTPR